MSALPAGRELDALVAEKVMGLGREVRVRGSSEHVMVWNSNPALGNGQWDAPALQTYGAALPYSTDIAAAWQVVEGMMAGDGYGFELTVESGVWECWFTHHAYDAGQAYADTAPLAICRAALAAVGAEP